MVKVIKRGEAAEVTEATPLGSELAPAADARRAPVIDRDTFEAKAAATTIRERAQAQAQELLAQAQSEAAATLAAATEQAQQLRAQAHSAGLEEGRQEGAASFSKMVAKSSARMQAAEAALAPQIGQLATHIARKVLGRELEFAPELVVDLVKQALAEKARQRKEISLRVHPDDLAVLREQRGQLVEVLSRCKEVALVEDGRVARYGVVIETDAGTIDAQLETQLAIFEQALAKLG